jgi:hypothetical protein
MISRTAPAALGDVEVLHGHQLGDRKAVVDLHHADLLPGIGDAGLLVGHRAAFGRRDQVIAVPLVEAHLFAAAQGELQRL